MLKYLKNYIHIIVLICIFTFLSIASMLLLIPLSKKLPEIFQEKSIYLLIQVSISIIGIYFAKGLFTYFQNYLTAYVSINSTSKLRKDIYHDILNTSMEILNDKKTGEFITIVIDDINKIRELIFSFISEFLPSCIMIFFTITYIFYLNWKLSLFVLILVPLIGALIAYFSKLIKEKAELIQKKVSDTYSALYENFVNYLVIRIFGIEKIKSSEFSNIENYNSKERLASIKLISLQPSVINLVQVTGICIIACFGGYEIMNNNLTLANLLAFGTALSLTIDPVIYLTKSIGVINTSKVSLKRCFDLKDILDKNQLAEYKNNLLKNISDYTLKFDELNFSYSNKGNNFSLNNINFEVKQGELVSINGKNGSGKSTILRLFLRLYKNYSGKIQLGNHDINQYDYKVFRDDIKACFSEAFLFNESIKENIVLYSENISNDDFIKVCDLTGVNSFVNDLENTFEFNVGELGNKLSSGQKQRIALARAIITKPKILILDEATSALDKETEKIIYQSIREFLPKTTIIIINHRQTSLSISDKTYLLENGSLY